MSRFKSFLTSILPGIFLIGYNVGTGSITSMSKAGANFGLDLLWSIGISCAITYYLITVFSRFTMVTGKTIIQGIKEHIHPGMALLLIAALSVIILTALIGVLGIIAEVLQVGSIRVFNSSLSVGAWAAVVGLGLFVLMWIGNYSFFEKVLAVFVAVMGLTFISTMFIRFPSLSELAKGFIPSVPSSAFGSDNSPMVIVAGMVGTTVSVFVFVIRTQIVKDTGWTMADNAIQKRDAFISASMMFIISAAVLITASTTLYVQDLKLNSVVDMIALLEPIAGKLALTVFVVGILAAGLSSHLPNLLVIPWLIIDYRNAERNTQSKGNRILLFLLTVISITGVAMGFKPVFIMMVSQACIAVVLPLTIASIFYLSNKESLMKEHKNRGMDNVWLALIMIFALYMGTLGIQGLLVDIAKL